MVNGRIPSVFSKTYVTPRRPYEKARLDQELKIIGEYGLRNKREVWRVKYTLAKIRKAARELLTLEEKDPKRLFEGIISNIILFIIFFFNCYDDISIIILTPLVLKFIEEYRRLPDDLILKHDNFLFWKIWC